MSHGRPEPTAACLPGGRLHLCHGPIDLVIGVDGTAPVVEAGHAAAVRCFATVLDELVAELPVLRRPVGVSPLALQGPVAWRMAAAVWPHREVFVTPMAAVAGAVADHVLATMLEAAPLRRAWVNDGGDIAMHLGPGQRLRLGLVGDIDEPRLDGTVVIDAGMPVRGVATSGRGGRSFSLGIADAVTVLAADGAAADVAATLIANAVDVDALTIERRPARELDPDSDLGDLPVTIGVGALSTDEVELALDGGAAVARTMLARGLIHAALLRLRGRDRTVGPVPALAVGRAA